MVHLLLFAVNLLSYIAKNIGIGVAQHCVNS